VGVDTFCFRPSDNDHELKSHRASAAALSVSAVQIDQSSEFSNS